MRNVYRSLGDDFLDIIQDSDATDKIAEILKKNQDSVDVNEPNKSLVSETTKQVATKTLDPNDCDILQVVLDFTNEIQTAILQVRMNLSRDYEHRKLEYAKSLKGQKEDIDRLNGAFKEQSDVMAEAMEQMSEDDLKFQEEQLKKTEKILNKFMGKDSIGTSL